MSRHDTIRTYMTDQGGLTMAEKNNVVLIGMPGSGKSTLGIVLAKIMTKDFIDADIVI